MVQNKIYNLQARLAKLKDQKKANNVFIIVRTEISVNEDTKRPQTKTMLNLLDMSRICCII